MNSMITESVKAKESTTYAFSNIVTIKGLTKRYGDITVLNKLDLEIRKGEILTFLGPSGCGKSTLMRLIAGFDTPTEGSLSLHDQDMTRMPPERRPVNMVFQRYALFPHLDVFDNIAFGLRLKKLPKAIIRDKVLKIMELVQLEKMASRWITELSGGQCQRVALARALVNEPEVLLLDEPLAALDLKIRQHMLVELKRIQDVTGTTFVYVTHDQDEAMILSSRIVLMNQGCIEQIATPDDLYFRPKSLFAAKFLGETNVISGIVTARSGNEMSAAFAGGTVRSTQYDAKVTVGSKIHILVRPESVHITPVLEPYIDDPQASNSCVATLKSILPIGGRVILVAELPDGTAIKAQQIRTGEPSAFYVGQSVHLSWRSDVMAMLIE
ncbi:ABC transporter ATP-binding protein [Pseudomonas sp. NPDC087342]|uniref:ABC transporter ATP-binding protein n=1 Tax=Pseudomonas sp. NPDC087342 TaxID=3364437 RepID=UPI0038261227